MTKYKCELCLKEKNAEEESCHFTIEFSNTEYLTPRSGVLLCKTCFKGGKQGKLLDQIKKIADSKPKY